MQKKQRIRKAVTVLLIIVCALTIGFQTVIHFYPHIRLVGTWHGDGALDLLGESPFDGALELTFFIDQTGCVVTSRGKTDFTYDVHEHTKWYVVTLDGGKGYHHGQRFFIDGKTLNIIRDEELVSFTRE